MKKVVLFCLLVAYIWLLPKVFGQVSAASLKFDKTSASVDVGGTLSVGVIVDAGSDEISSTDIYVTYDASFVEAQSVDAGSFFPTVTNNISSGRIYIAGMVDDPASSKTGSGTVATITFKGLKNGSGAISFDFTSSKVIKDDINATNIMDCNANGSLTVTVGSGGTPVNPTELPKSGIFDDMVKWSQWGIVLVIVGGVVRLLLL